MFALLKLVPIKDWLYGGAIIAILLSGIGFIHHERAVGAAAVQAADQRAHDARIAHNTEVETRAKTLADAQVAAYKATLAAPPPADAPRLRCRAVESAARLPANVGSGPALDAGTNSGTAGAQDSGPVFDPGPDLTKLLRDADAHIRALQQYISDCQQEGVCRTQ